MDVKTCVYCGGADHPAECGQPADPPVRLDPDIGPVVSSWWEVAAIFAAIPVLTTVYVVLAVYAL